MSRWIELSFIEDCKTLHRYGMTEYYNKANKGLYKFNIEIKDTTFVITKK